MLSEAFGRLRALANPLPTRVADQGSGKLRNLRLIGPHAKKLWLIDTARQLESHLICGNRLVPLRDVAATWARRNHAAVRLLDTDAFARSRLGLDLVCSVCVFDVLPAPDRSAVIAAAYRNLRPGGWYLVIVPRNDASIVRRCTDANRFADGFAFPNHGAYTFYRNFDRAESLIRPLRMGGFSLVEDLSRHRYVVLLLQR